MGLRNIISKSRVSIISTLITLFLSFVQCKNETFNVVAYPQDITILVNETQEVVLEISGNLNKNVLVTFKIEHATVCDIKPSNIYLGPKDDSKNETLSITGLNPGHTEISTSTIPEVVQITNNVFFRVTIANSWIIWYISIIFGWIYFVAWSISFYPQIYINWKNKSVIGLNFDFISLNICGFLLYTAFNIGLYFIPEIQQEYTKRHPRGLNPVLINDVFFSIHAVFATLITISQCFLYERAEQRISFIATGILSLFGITLIISAILVISNVFHWLDFLYICSYVKLTITLIKYIPQAIMNYRRKSTTGWSIGNIILDFVGGSLSMLQMVLNAYNYDDWVSIFGDPTKFGLGLFSVLFDIFFMLQHYVFYRQDKSLSENNLCTSETATTIVDESQCETVKY